MCLLFGFGPGAPNGGFRFSWCCPFKTIRINDRINKSNYLHKVLLLKLNDLLVILNLIIVEQIYLLFLMFLVLILMDIPIHNYYESQKGYPQKRHPLPPTVFTHGGSLEDQNPPGTLA